MLLQANSDTLYAPALFACTNAQEGVDPQLDRMLMRLDALEQATRALLLALLLIDNLFAAQSVTQVFDCGQL